jgi:tetratricopeptide (TPR) repeat protein
MSTYKCIFSGRLEFGSERAFQQVLKLYQHRSENHYRNDVILKSEEVFDEETFTLNVPRHLSESSKKSWLNTVNMLEYVADFAIVGQMSAWLTDSGKLLDSRTIEPQGDKVAVQEFLKGREIVEEDGRELEAIESFSRAIEKFERHSLAYERRGHTNYRLRNYKDALYDFNKSIDIYEHNAMSFFGRAKVYMAQGQYSDALPDLVEAVKKSIPHQPVFWRSRFLKGEVHLHLKQYNEAVTEFQFFIKRNFEKEDPNYPYRKQAFFHLGRALLGMNKYREAVEAFNQPLIGGAEQMKTLGADYWLYRGIARQKAGERDFASDWTEAASMGSSKAAELLEESAAGN